MFPGGIKPCLARLPAIDDPDCMRISDEALNEFIGLYKEEFGEEIDRAQASEMAFRLVTLYERLARGTGQDVMPAPLDDPPHRPIGFRA